MNYYLVAAKCGHVGRGKYHEVQFPICANSKSEAAQICLKRGKVKKQLKNAITYVIEITHDVYLIKKDEISNDIYVRAHTKKEIGDYLQSAETLCFEKHLRRSSFQTRKERIAFIMKKQKYREEYVYA